MAKASKAPNPLQDNIAYPPRGLRSPRAAAYIGVSESSFLVLVDEGLMPKPKRIKGMVIWDRLELDAAFEALTEEDRRRNTAEDFFGIRK